MLYSAKARHEKYLRNKKKELAASKRWKQNNKKKVSASALRYYYRNKEKCRAKRLVWYTKTFQKRRLARLLYTQLIWLAFRDELREAQRKLQHRKYTTDDSFRSAHERRVLKYQYGEAWALALITRNIYKETNKQKRKEKL